MIVIQSMFYDSKRDFDYRKFYQASANGVLEELFAEFTEEEHPSSNDLGIVSAREPVCGSLTHIYCITERFAFPKDWDSYEGELPEDEWIIERYSVEDRSFTEVSALPEGVRFSSPFDRKFLGMSERGGAAAVMSDTSGNQVLVQINCINGNFSAKTLPYSINTDHVFLSENLRSENTDIYSTETGEWVFSVDVWGWHSIFHINEADQYVMRRTTSGEISGDWHIFKHSFSGAVKSLSDRFSDRWPIAGDGWPARDIYETSNRSTDKIAIQYLSKTTGQDEIIVLDVATEEFETYPAVPGYQVGRASPISADYSRLSDSGQYYFDDQAFAIVDIFNGTGTPVERGYDAKFLFFLSGSVEAPEQGFWTAFSATVETI